MISILLYTILGLASFYFLFFYESRKAKMLSKLKGPKGLPIIGLVFTFLNVSNEELFHWVSSVMMLHNGLTIAWLFHMPYISMARCDVVQKVLSSNTHIDKSRDYDMVKPWLGLGLLTSAGERWRKRRHLLTPAFHFRILEDFVDVMNEQAMTLVKILKDEFGNGQVFNVFPYITRCALDIICETAMGKKINAQGQKDSEYVRAVYRITELIQHRQKSPWLHPPFIWRRSPSGREEAKLLAILHGFTESVIRERKAELSAQLRESSKSNEAVKNNGGSEETKKGKPRPAFLDLLLRVQAEGKESGSEDVLTDLDIREETDTFTFEGHDTTAANLNWTVFMLGCNPECQAKVHKELDGIFGDDRERPMTHQDISQMKYLECCIKETLRLYPSVPIIARAINTDLEINEDLTIPGGSTAFIVPYSMHRDPEVFPVPEFFLPDRFFPENSVGRNPYAYVPFSGGPRNCIGQKFAMIEEKVILANIFRNFTVVAAERRENLVLLAEIVMRPKNGLHIKLIPRS